MAAAVGAVAAEDRRAGKRQVADRVEHLVTGEFVGEAQAFRIDDAIVADNDGVLERGAEGKAARPQLLDLGEEAEGACPRDIAAEAFRIDVGGELLPADQRVLEVDLDLDAAAVIGRELGKRVAGLDAHGLENPDVAARRVEPGDTRLIDRGDEGAGAAVHDRHFRPVNLDHDVVDVERAERRHEVLDGGDRRTRRADRGAEIGGVDVGELRGDFPIAPGGDIGAEESDAGIGLGGMESYRDIAAAVHPDARNGSSPTQGRLSSPLCHHDQLTPQSRPRRICGTRRPIGLRFQENRTCDPPSGDPGSRGLPHRRPRSRDYGDGA